MQRGEDDLEGRRVLELGVGIHGNAAAVVAHRDRVVGGQLQIDAGGVAGHRLVHGVVQDLRHQMVEPPLIGAADEHGGTPAHRLQALEDLDVLGRIVFSFTYRLLHNAHP